VDVVVKDAFISDLRQQNKQLSAERKQLVARRDQFVEERRRLLARQEALETKLRALQTYVNSAGFRFVENVTRQLRRFPRAFRTTRTIARKVVGRGAAAD
jgi:chromosome segregation ATPase